MGAHVSMWIFITLSTYLVPIACVLGGYPCIRIERSGLFLIVFAIIVDFSVLLFVYAVNTAMYACINFIYLWLMTNQVLKEL